MNELVEPLDRLASARLGGDGIAGLTRLTAGASQEIWRFSVVKDGVETPLILRRAPGGDRVSESAIGPVVEASLIQAAVAGQGIALGRLPLIDQLVKARKLVAPFAGAVVSPRGYCLIVSPQAADKPEVAAFTAWLRAAARGPDSAAPKGRARP